MNEQQIYDQLDLYEWIFEAITDRKNAYSNLMTLRDKLVELLVQYRGDNLKQAITDINKVIGKLDKEVATYEDEEIISRPDLM